MDVAVKPFRLKVDSLTEENQGLKEEIRKLKETKKWAVDSCNEKLRRAEAKINTLLNSEETLKETVQALQEKETLIKGGTQLIVERKTLAGRGIDTQSYLSVDKRSLQPKTKHVIKFPTTEEGFEKLLSLLRQEIPTYQGSVSDLQSLFNTPDARKEFSVH